MITRSLLLIAITLKLNLVSANETPLPETVQAHDFITLFEKLNGVHPGFRRAHASGVCATGRFEPNSDNAFFADAPLLESGALDVSIRFSVGGGVPRPDERIPGTRGVGLQISLPDGTVHTFTGNNFPVFAGKDPKTFYGFLSTLLPDKNGNRDPQRTVDFVKSHPSVQANAMWNKNAQTTASYGNTAFYGLHTFFYSNGEDKIMFRWTLEPELGSKTLTDSERESIASSFLASELASQIEKGEVAFRLNVTIGEAGDVVDDPSQQWPQDRQSVLLGRVVLESSGGEACNNVNYDPNRLSKGFSPSNDPVLKMRSAAYAISFGKRLSGQ